MADEPVRPPDWPRPERHELTFGDTQAIRWLRKKFSGPALTALGLVLTASCGYIATMETRMRAIEADLRDIKHDMPKGDFGVGAMHDELSDVKARLAAIDARLEGENDALKRIYGRFDMDYIDGMAPLSKRKRK